MTYTDTSATDLTFNNFTSFSDYNSTMNFFLGSLAFVDGKNIDLNDNEYIKV
jgi:hypothetical protein